MSENETVGRYVPGADVSASEAANYTFCAKAWHLEHVLGAMPPREAGQRRLAGIEAHAKHGSDLRGANRASTWLVRGLVALLLIALAVLVLGLALALR